jgi:hypothetical protein
MSSPKNGVNLPEWQSGRLYLDMAEYLASRLPQSTDCLAGPQAKKEVEMAA